MSDRKSGEHNYAIHMSIHEVKDAVTNLQEAQANALTMTENRTNAIYTESVRVDQERSDQAVGVVSQEPTAIKAEVVRVGNIAQTESTIGGSAESQSGGSCKPGPDCPQRVPVWEDR